MRIRRAYDSGEYRRNRRLARANALYCAICGQPIKPGEPIDVHHIDTIAARRTRGLAPDNTIRNLIATHRRCNRGYQPPKPKPKTRSEIWP
jgi:hypothetical protein